MSIPTGTILNVEITTPSSPKAAWSGQVEVVKVLDLGTIGWVSQGPGRPFIKVIVKPVNPNNSFFASFKDDTYSLLGNLQFVIDMTEAINNKVSYYTKLILNGVHEDVRIDVI